MKLFLKYIRSKIKTIFLFVLLVLVFFVCLKLYRLPLKILIYPVLLCAFILVLFFLSDFFKTKKKYKILMQMENQTFEMINNLPQSETLCEYGLGKIVLSLKKQIGDIKSSYLSVYNDTVDYYTVWAHQIKTPISSMKLTLQNEDSALSRRLSSELFRIEQYVNMVLIYLRLDSESTDYVFKEYSLDKIIKASVKRFASDFIDKKINLIYTPSDKMIITDEKWFSFIIEQMLSNALKYTNKGYVKIYLPDENTVCIEDTGIGIAESDLPRIFEKGFTGLTGRTDVTSSGIGLYLCKRIADNLGIGISVSSKSGEGSTFSIDISQNKTKFE